VRPGLKPNLTSGNMIRKTLRILPLLILIGSGILLLEGSPLLGRPLVAGSEIPLGTLIAWLCLSTLPLSMVAGIRYIRKPISAVYRFYKRAFSLFILLGLAWGLFSNFLAGNWNFVFSGEEAFRGSETAFTVFVAYTAFIVLGSLLTFIIFLIHHLSITLKQKP